LERLKTVTEVHVRDYVQQHAIVDVKADVEKHVQEVALDNVEAIVLEVAVLIVQKDVVVAVQEVALTNAD